MVVLDSSFLIAYYNPRDVHHAAAGRAMVRLLGGAWGQAVLLEYVFLEVVTVILARLGLEAASAAGATLLAARETTFVSCSDLFQEAWSVFRRQEGADLSLVDAAVIVAARREPPGYVLTFDKDFVGREGVDVLPG